MNPKKIRARLAISNLVGAFHRRLDENLLNKILYNASRLITRGENTEAIVMTHYGGISFYADQQIGRLEAEIEQLKEAKFKAQRIYVKYLEGENDEANSSVSESG